MTDKIIYIHEKTPRPPYMDNKIVNVALIICGILMYSMFVILAVCCIVYDQEYFVAFLFLTMPILIVGLIYYSTYNDYRSYIVVSENTFTEYKHILWFVRVRVYNISDISKFVFVYPYSLKIRGTRYRTVNYFLVYDKKGKYLFKFCACEVTENIVNELSQKNNITIVKDR